MTAASIPFAAVAAAFTQGEVTVSAAVRDSVPRFFGNVYRVVVTVACGGFAFEIIDEIGQSIDDFDVYQPSPLPLQEVMLSPGDAALAEKMGFSAASGDLAHPLALAIATSHRQAVRQALARLFPQLTRHPA
jgi:hypothetical protein